MLKQARNLETYKDKQYLVFDFGDKCVKYDLANKQAYGFSGKPVKNIKTQLRGITTSDIFDTFKDKAYGSLFKYIVNNEAHVTNIGSLLELVDKYGDAEQFACAGLLLPNNADYLTYKITDIKKGCIKYLRRYCIPVTDLRIQLYNSDPDFYNYLMREDWVGFTDDDMLEFITWGCKCYIDELVNVYGYDRRALLKYLDKIEAYEACSVGWGIVRELKDYADMASAISPKYERYPKNFLTTFHTTRRNYERLKVKFDEEKFAKIRRADFEKRIGNYIFIYPKTTQDIKDESVHMHNCVGSYISRVLAGACHIMFLRKADAPDKSLITIEIRNGKVVQALRAYNAHLLPADKKVIETFNKYLKTITKVDKVSKV